MWLAPGASLAAKIFDAGMEKPQGAENSAAKKTAPLSLTPLRISENASIFGPPDFLQSSLAPAQSNPLPLAARANDGDARAWIYAQAHCTIVVLKGISGSCE